MTEPLPDLNAMGLPDLYAHLARGGLVRRLFELMRDEDLGEASPTGDITALASARASGNRERPLRATVRAREPGVLAGTAALPTMLEVFAPNVQMTGALADGKACRPSETVLTLEGPAAEVVVVERPLLNLIGRLSGVATRTAAFVRAIEEAAPGSGCRLLDTRKTTPGLRVLEKYAVRCGGGCNHRLGLHDAVLVKDNHIAGMSARELTAHATALAEAARADRPLRYVEFETDTIEQARALFAVRPGLVDVVMLDNYAEDGLREAVRLRDELAPGVLLEASGGIALETVGAVARTGVDRISSGSLTHGATWLDFGLDAGEQTPQSSVSPASNRSM